MFVYSWAPNSETHSLASSCWISTSVPHIFCVSVFAQSSHIRVQEPLECRWKGCAPAGLHHVACYNICWPNSKRLQPTFRPSPSLEHSSQTTRPQLRQWCFEASEVKTVSQRRPCPSCAVQNGRWHSCRVETSELHHKVSPIIGVVIWGFIYGTLECIIGTYRDTVFSNLGFRKCEPAPIQLLLLPTPCHWTELQMHVFLSHINS